MNRKLTFANCSDAAKALFKDADTHSAFMQLCYDTAYGRPQQSITLEQANKKIREKMLMLAELPQNPSEYDVRRAFKKRRIRDAVFEVIEDTVDEVVLTGWLNDPVWKRYVDVKSLKLGDKNIFYTRDDCVVVVSEIANGHHSIERQRLGRGKEFSVDVKTYGAKVYMEFVRYAQGVEDWGYLIGKIAEAYTRHTNTMLHDCFIKAADSLPNPTKWNKEGELAPSNHDAFVRLVNDVQIATGSPAVIIGTKVALSGLHKLGDVQWASNEAKSDLYNIGRLGTFEGTDILELPQVFAYNDETSYLEDDTKLYIMPTAGDQFIKAFYEGVEETYERTEPFDNNDDTREYEVRARFGVKAVLSKRFGTWTIGD